MTATKLFGQVINARNHTHLRAALSTTLAVCQADPALLHAFVALRINLVTAVSHIITVSCSAVLSFSLYVCFWSLDLLEIFCSDI